MLLDRIQKQIEQKALKDNIMGTEKIKVQVKLNKQEIKEFEELSKTFDEHYKWFLNEDKLNISFQEELFEGEGIFKALYIDFRNLQTNIEEFDFAVQSVLNIEQSIFDDIESYINAQENKGSFIYYPLQIKNGVKFDFDILDDISNIKDYKNVSIRIKDISIPNLL